MVFARLSMSSLVQCKRPNETHAVSRRLRARDLLKTMRAVHGNGNSHSDSGRYGIVKGRPAATATVPQRATPTPRPRPTRPPTPAVLYVASGTFGVQGILYTLDPATGAVFTTVAPLNDAAGNNYGITGLKYHPFTGIFYGVTRDPTNPDYLVLVNPATALVTPIGPGGYSYRYGDQSDDRVHVCRLWCKSKLLHHQNRDRPGSLDRVNRHWFPKRRRPGS